jgi:hypothetical protein
MLILLIIKEKLIEVACIMERYKKEFKEKQQLNEIKVSSPAFAEQLIQDAVVYLASRFEFQKQKVTDSIFNSISNGLAEVYEGNDGQIEIRNTLQSFNKKLQWLISQYSHIKSEE